MDELPEDLFLDIPAHRAKVMEYVTSCLLQQVDGLAEYPARAAAAVAVSIFELDFRDARSYRWLRDQIIKTMPDPELWGDDASEDSVLARYVGHLATATHGQCLACGRQVKAGDRFDPVNAVGDPVPPGSPDTRAIYCRECV